MGVEVIQIVFTDFFILYNKSKTTLSRKTDYPIIVNVHPQRLDAGDEHIDPHIEL
jgi:hypothetical protein